MDERYFLVVILLSYTTIAFIFGLCLFAYQCYEYKKCGTMLKWEYWFDFDKWDGKLPVYGTTPTLFRDLGK